MRHVNQDFGIHDDESIADPPTETYAAEPLPSRRRGLPHDARLPPVGIARRLFEAQYSVGAPRPRGARRASADRTLPSPSISAPSFP